MKRERKFKVIADTCEGAGKKIFNGGDIVSEYDFVVGRADLLVSRKFLKEENALALTDDQLSDQEKKDDILSDEKKEIAADLRGPKLEKLLTPDEKAKIANNDLGAENESVKDNTILGEADKLKNISVEEIIADLNKAEVKFDINSSKEELYKLWLLI